MTYTGVSATNLPLGLSLNRGNGQITGTLNGADDAHSPYTVTVTAFDKNQVHSTSQTFTWTVVPRVTITPPGDQLNADGDVVSLQIAASAADGGTLTYGAPNLPLGLNISSTGLISGTIGGMDDTTSPYAVTVTASEGTWTASQQFIWSVAHILVTPPGDQSSTDSQIVSLPIQARHADTTPVTFSAVGLPPNLTINASTGVISGKLSLTADAGSPYTVTVQATEGNYSAGQTFTWTVSPLMVMSPTNQSHVAGTTVSLPIHVRYNGAAPLTYSATGLPPGLSINPQTGVISGRITPAAVWRRYNAAVMVTDGPHRSGTAFLWTVSPPGNQVPVLTNPGNQINNEDDDIALPILASDPDGDPLTYSATGLPSGLSIDPGSGWITGSLDDTAFSDVPFPVTVTVDDGNGGTASQTFNWQFTAPALTATPATVSPTEGTAFSGTVANFTNANVGSAEFAGEYEITIDWGDGTGLDTGTATGSNGFYSVLGDHIYQENGSYSITVTIADESLASTTVTSTATVTDTPVTATAVPVSLLVGSGTMVPVATFTDLNPNDADYAATISWGGGGGSSSGTISGLNGKFVVFGSHAYALHGPYTVGITITDGGVMVATTSTTATVGDYYEGQLNFNVAFTDDDYYGVISDYTRTVQWGDGTSDNGMLTQSGGIFHLTDSHTFAPGQYPFSVTIADQGGAPPLTYNQTLFIAEQPLTAYTAPVYGTTGQTISNQTIALITDPDPTGSASGASIDWGDGSMPDGSVTGGGGLFSVVGSHDYNRAGNYPVAFNFSSTSGLVLPGVVQAVLAQNKAVVGKGGFGTVNATGGTLTWAITAQQGKWLANRAQATFLFMPSKDCKCENIAFIQVVTRWTLGKDTVVWPSKGGKEFFEKYSTKPSVGNHLDFLPGYTSPYPNAVWNGTSWVSRPYLTRVLGNGPKKTDATTTDYPQTGQARTGKGVAIHEFETAAFCIDSQEVLGVLKWGIQTPDNNTDPMVVLNATAKGDFKLSGSTDFKTLVARANKVGVSKDDQKMPLVMNHAQPDGNPRISKPLKNLLGGTSALPGN